AGMAFVHHVPYLAGDSRSEDRGHLISLGFSIQILTRMVVSLGGGALPGLLAAALGIGSRDPAAYRGVLLLGACVTALSAIPVSRIREREAGEGRSGVQAFRRSGKDRSVRPERPNARTPERLNAPSPWPLLLTLAAVSAFRG